MADRLSSFELTLIGQRDEAEAELAAARDREKGLIEAGNRIVRNVQDDWRGEVIESELTQDAIRAWRDLLSPERHDEEKDHGPNSAVTGEKLKWKKKANTRPSDLGDDLGTLYET